MKAPENILLLIRHAPVMVIPSSSSHEWLLSDEGKAKCNSFARDISDFSLSELLTSPESKAVETAKILGSALSLDWQITMGLEEHKRETAPFFSSHADFKAAVGQLFTYPTMRVFGEESAVEAFTRFDGTVTNQLTLKPKSTLGIVTHGTVMTLFICHYNPQIDPKTFWEKLTLPCAAVLDRNSFQLEKLILS